MPSRFVTEGKCNKCGGNAFSVPDNASDDTWITCDGCGRRLMTWKAFKAGALEVANADFTTRNEKASADRGP